MERIGTMARMIPKEAFELGGRKDAFLCLAETVEGSRRHESVRAGLSHITLDRVICHPISLNIDCLQAWG